MADFILRPEKLAKLPKGFQDAVKALDNTQLSYLQAAFSNIACFNFLALPLEIRLQILREVLPRSFYTTNCRSLKKQRLASVPAVLTVNKQVNSEAKMVLMESTTATLNLSYNYDLPRSQKDALRTVRKFDVKVKTQKTTFKWEDDEEMCKLLMRVCSEIVKGHRSRDANARFFLSVHLVNDRGYYCGTKGRKIVYTRAKATSTGPDSPSRTKSEQVLHEFATKLLAKLVERLPNSSVAVESAVTTLQ